MSTIAAPENLGRPDLPRVQFGRNYSALRIIFPRPEFFFRKIENAWHKIAVCSARRENFYVPEATTTPRSNSGVFARARFGGGATAVYSLGETMIGALWAR